MLKPVPSRITYAQQKIIKLIENRELRKWCAANGLTHSAMYRLAFGEQLPSYRIISSVCHLIAPIEWLFFTDEQLPYPPQLVPQWNAENICKFVKQHKFDYRATGEKYGLSELSAYNIFVAYRAKPTVELIKKACLEVNPIDFFTDGDIPVLQNYVAKRGDIVSIDNTCVFVLSNKIQNEKEHSFIGCNITQPCEKGLKLENLSTKGYINYHSINTYCYKNPPALIESLDEKTISTVLTAIQQIFM